MKKEKIEMWGFWKFWRESVRFYMFFDVSNPFKAIGAYRRYKKIFKEENNPPTSKEY